MSMLCFFDDLRVLNDEWYFALLKTGHRNTNSKSCDEGARALQLFYINQSLHHQQLLTAFEQETSWGLDPSWWFEFCFTFGRWSKPQVDITVLCCCCVGSSFGQSFKTSI